MTPSFVDNLHLLTHALLVDFLEYLGNEVTVHTAECTLCPALFENLCVAGSLKDCHVVLLLVLTDFTAYAHTLGEKIHELVVDFVNLMTELGDALCGSGLTAHYEQREDIVEHIGGNLLLGVAPCAIGIAVALNDKSVETEVHSLLAKRCHEFATTSNVRRVADDGQIGYATMQFDRNLPHRHVAVYLLVVA